MDGSWFLDGQIKTADMLAVEAIPLDRINPGQVQKGLSESQKLSSICWGTLGLVGIRLYGSSRKRQDFKGVKRDIFGVQRCFLDFIPDEDVFGLDLLGLPIGHIGLPEVYKKLGRSVGNRSVFTDMASDGPICLMGREKVFRSYAGEIFSSYQVPVRSWRYSQGECGNVTTDAMRRLRSSLLLIKTPSCASIYTPCGNDLNIVLRSVLRGLIILIWSYYGKVKSSYLLQMPYPSKQKDAVRIAFCMMPGCSVSFMGVNSRWRLADMLAVEAIPLDRINPGQVQKGLSESHRSLAQLERGALVLREFVLNS
ncbi:hypothetical protein Tco_0742911 [Tanacetum coccineum]